MGSLESDPAEPPTEPVVTTERTAPRREMDPHLLLIVLLAVIALLARW